MSDVSVSLGITGKDTVIGAFQDVSKAGEVMGKALMEHTKKLFEMYVGWEAVKKGAEQFMAALNEGGRLSNFSDQTGIAVEKLALLERAFQNNGMEAEELGRIVNKMQKYLVDAGDSGSEAAYHIAQLGLNYRALASLSPDEQFKAVGQAIASIPDPAERSAAAMGVFGRAGGKLMAFFKDFDGSVAEAKDQLGSYTSIMGMSASDFEKLGDTIENGIGHKFIEFATGALSETVGGLQKLADIVAKWDAADFGQKLAKSLGEPLKAFAKDISEGNFKNAWEIVFETAKLQAMRMANEFYKVGAVLTGGIKSGLSTLFSKDSDFVKQAENIFTYLSHFLQKSILEGLSDVFKAIPGMAGTAEKLMEKVNGVAAKPSEFKWDDMTQSQHWTEATAAQKGLAQQLKEDAQTVADGWDKAGSTIGDALQNSAESVQHLWSDSKNTLFDLSAQQDRLAKIAAQQNGAGSSAEKPPTPSGTSPAGPVNPMGLGGGSARWTAKPQPILPDEVLDTGMYKNTANLSLDQQQALAAASMRIQGQQPAWYEQYVKQDMASGNYSQAAYWQRQIADYRQREGARALESIINPSVSPGVTDNGSGLIGSLTDSGSGSGGSGLIGSLTGTINKNAGPKASESASGKTEAKKDPMSSALEAILSVVKDINEHKLPVVALS